MRLVLISRLLLCSSCVVLCRNVLVFFGEKLLIVELGKKLMCCCGVLVSVVSCLVFV